MTRGRHGIWHMVDMNANIVLWKPLTRQKKKNCANIFPTKKKKLKKKKEEKENE